MDAVLHAEGLGRRFGRLWALAHVDLTVPLGQSLLLAGANGSGKTTLLRLAAGLHRPTAGSLSLFGLDPRKQRTAVRRRISLVSHHSFLYDRLTAAENLRIAARLLGRPARRADLMPLLEQVGLADRADSAVGGFSAGMRKRLQIARTRLEAPDLILLDEPFSALDAAGRRMVEAWVQSLREEGRTLLIASHLVHRAGALCDAGLLLEQGQVRMRGDPDQVAAAMESGP